MVQSEYYLHIIQMINVFMLGGLVYRWFMNDRFSQIDNAFNELLEQVLRLAKNSIETEKRMKELEKRDR